jgi:thioredoxin-like negative regulator of GroEL
MENVAIVTEENFETEVQNNSGLTLIDFWAPWC